MRFATTHKPAAPRALRPLAFAVVLLAVWAHISSLAHMVLVQHVACAEHGELVHPGEGGHEHASVSHGGNSPQVDGDATGAAEEHHEHCGLAAHRREQVSHAAGSVALAIVDGAPPPAIVSGVFTPSRDVRPPSVALYRLAPKTSPPV